MEEKRIITNSEIAQAVEEALEEHGLEWHPLSGHNRIIDEIDIERSPEDEEIPVNPEIINQFINGFLAECEEP